MGKKCLCFLLIVLMTVTMIGCKARNDKDAAAVISTVSNTTADVQPAAQTQEDTVSKPETTQASDSGFVFPAEGIRPFAVMIDNEGTRVLPQGGLDKAQVIYEIIVEGGITRLMPVFWGTDTKMIGPVRSSRHYFLDYAMEHDAIYVHFGWSPMAMNDISKFKINNIDGITNASEIFWDLTKDRRNWQDSYTSMKNILAHVKKVKFRVETDKKLVFAYNKSDVELSGGQDALNVNLRYSASYTSGFKYNAESKTYDRFRQGKPQMERMSNKQLTAKNIIIQVVGSKRIKNDDKDRQELANVGSGYGWYITCGKAVKIKWEKDSRSAPTSYTDESGSRIMLNPGQTWVQIIPSTGSVSIK